jgi:hypothetical protein
MGTNFVMGCEKCQEKVYLYRGEESKPMHAFFREHAKCFLFSRNAFLFGDDQILEDDWMTDYNTSKHEERQ